MKTRDIKELLILLREFLSEHIQEHVCGSMCWSAFEMRDRGMMTDKECITLIEYINGHKPKLRGGGGFWWKYKSLVPRIKFLNKLISEL